MCLIIHHKGISSDGKKIKSNASMIEFDVRVTKDQIPIISHDAFIQNFKIKDTSLRQLKTISPDLLTLAEVIKSNKNTALFIEIKPGVNCTPILEQIQKIPTSQLKLCFIASFDIKVLLFFKEHLPDIKRVVLESWLTSRLLNNAKRANTRTLAISQRWIYGLYIQMLVKRGYEVLVYTLNSPMKANRWLKVGLQGIITDNPNKFTKS